MQSVGGDLLCQFGIERNSSVDFQRCGRFFVIGSCLTAPLYHFWFAALARHIPGGASGGLVPGLKKLAVDQLLMPHFYNPVFLLVRALSGGAPNPPQPSQSQHAEPSPGGCSV